MEDARQPSNPLTSWASDVRSQLAVVPVCTKTLIIALLTCGLLFKLLSQDHGAGLIVGTIPAFIFSTNFLEVHRLLVSHFFSTGLLAALISAYYVYQIGVRIESSHGTFHFALLALGLPIVINTLFVVIATTAGYVFQSPALWMMKTQGYWGAIMMLVVVDCSLFPQLPRRLFIWSVTTKMYPWFIFLLLSIMSGATMDLPVGAVVGMVYTVLLPRHRAALSEMVGKLERSSAFRVVVSARGFVSMASSSAIDVTAAASWGSSGGGGGGAAAPAADPWRQPWEGGEDRAANAAAPQTSIAMMESGAAAAAAEEGRASSSETVAVDPAVAAAMRESRRAAVAAAAQRRAEQM